MIQKFKESGHFPAIVSECYVLKMREIFWISYIGHILWGKHRRYSFHCSGAKCRVSDVRTVIFFHCMSTMFLL